MTLLPDNERPALVVAGRYRGARAGRERAAVVLAMHLPCWLEDEDGGAVLLVRPEDAEAVAAQLGRFERERRFWPPRLPPPEPAPTTARWRAARGAALFWALLEAAAFCLQVRSRGRAEDWGALSSGPIFRHGQLWRPLTALFLHGDTLHLLGNLAAGYFAFAAVLAAGRSLGRSALALLGSALAGNLAAAALQGPLDQSLGASTAVFAALGILTGRAARHAWRQGPGERWRWWRMLAPLGAGGALLALYGQGTPETDVVAHLAGFAAGLLAGIA